MSKAWPWLAAFVLVALIAPTPLGAILNRGGLALAQRVAHPFANAREALALGGGAAFALPLFLALTLDPALPWRDRLLAWSLMAAGEAVELACKHFHFGSHAVAGQVLQWHGLLPSVDWSGRGSGLALRGTFPSGHLLRLTMVAGYLWASPGWLLPALVAVVGGVAMIAAGLHSLTDALGGAALAFGALATAGRLQPPAGTRRHRRRGRG